MAHPGRPTKYNEQFHPLLAESLARIGLTDIEMAEKLGVTESTFYLWKSKYKDFSEAIQRGKDTPDDQVENALLKRALGFREPATKAFNSNGTVIYGEYEEYYPPDTAAAFIWLKNRRPEKWRDRRELEHSGDINILADWIKDGEKGNPEKKLPGKT